ncbi:MAG: tetratricopeptide repeat protein [Deltaproteobacteria bacterium]|nr:tetratricopeptide repeat protein [Deltaproteobacteria bacterium]
MRWVTVLVLCGWPGLALSADEIEEAEQLRKSMQYEQAVEHCVQILESSGSGPAELVKAYCIMGLSQSALGKPKDALDSFSRLLAVDPDFTLSPRISPRLAAPFFQARALMDDQKSIAIKHAPQAPLASPEAFSGAVLDVELTADPFGMVKEIAIRYRTQGIPQDLEISVRVESTGKFAIRLPEGLKTRSIDYLIEARNAHGSVLLRMGEKKRFVLAVGVAESGVAADKPQPADSQPEQSASVETSKRDWFELQVHACVMGNEVFGRQGGDAGVSLSQDPVIDAQMGVDRYGGGLRGGMRLGAYHFAYLHFDYLWEQWSGYAGADQQVDWSAGFNYLRILAGYRFAYPVLDWLEPFAECAIGAHVYIPRILRIDIGGEIDEADVVPDSRFALMLGFGLRFVFLERFFATGSYLIDMPITMSSSSFVLGGGMSF